MKLRLGLSIVALLSTGAVADPDDTGPIIEGAFVDLPMDETCLAATRSSNETESRRLAHPNDQRYMARDLDLVGEDIGSVKGPYSQCKVHCGSNLRCRSYTWTDYQGGTCWLKGSVNGSFRYKPGAISVLMENRSGPRTMLVSNCDLPGFDVGSTRGVTYKACANVCEAIVECTAYTWTNYDGGRCWHKREIRNCKMTQGPQTVILFRREY